MLIQRCQGKIAKRASSMNWSLIWEDDLAYKLRYKYSTSRRNSRFGHRIMLYGKQFNHGAKWGN